MNILTINPGSTSTKIGLFKDAESVFIEKIAHDSAELKKFDRISDQLEYRLGHIAEILKEREVDICELDAVSARGGLLRPMEGGTYRINKKMLEDLRKGVMGEHASNLGGIIAHALTRGSEIPAFIVDPVVVDELIPAARITGVPGIKRNSIFHALNQKAAARKAAWQMGLAYHDLNLVVAHLGGGISVGAHHKGRVIDVNDALYGDGPMAPERAGRVSPYAFATLARKKKWDDRQTRKALVGGGGIAGLLGTTDMQAIELRVQDGDLEAEQIYDAMIHQIVREIGAMATVLRGQVDAIVITGGLAHSAFCINKIMAYIEYISKIIVIPGEEELEALAAGALRVLKGEETAKEY